MKNFVIAVNDFLLYMALLMLSVFSVAVGETTDWLRAGLIFGGGLLIWCVICGFWFVMSGIYDQLVELNRKTK